MRPSQASVRSTTQPSPEGEGSECEARWARRPSRPVPAQPLGALDPTPGDTQDNTAPAAGAAAASEVIALVGVQPGRVLARPSGVLPDGRHRVEHPWTRRVQASMVLSWTFTGVSVRARGMPFASTMIGQQADHPSATQRPSEDGRGDGPFRARLAAVGRVRGGPFAPLFAGMEALSSEQRPQSIAFARPNRSSSTRWSLAHTPAACQSRSRRQQLIPRPHPISCGSISHRPSADGRSDPRSGRGQQAAKGNAALQHEQDAGQRGAVRHRRAAAS